MNKSEIFKAAHKATKAALKSGDSYAVTFSCALKGIYMRELTSGKIPTGFSRSNKSTQVFEYSFTLNHEPSAVEFAVIDRTAKLDTVFVLGKKVGEFTKFEEARSVLDAEFSKFVAEFFPEVAEREAARLVKQAEQDAKHAEAAKKSKQTAEFLGMPELKGTERQVVWAEQIRTKFLAKASEKDATKAKKRTTAKWWIENRASL